MPHIFQSVGGIQSEQKVFLAIPTYRDLPAGFVHCLWGANMALNSAGIGSTLEILSANCHVDDGRNLLVRDFLESDCTDLVFIDADVIFQPEDVVNLLLPKRDVVAGVYPLKQNNEEFPVRTSGDLWSDSHGLVEVEGVPTGFLRISRRALEILEKDADKFKARLDLKERRPIPIIFERTFNNGIRYGGDYTFCMKWLEHGKIYVNPEMNLGHVGDFQWSGMLGDYWKREHGVYEQEFEQAIEAVRNGTDTEKDHKALCQYWGNIPWAAGWGLLGQWIGFARKSEGNILEVGAGLTSIMAAIANPEQIVYALEHDVEWADKIQLFAQKYDVPNLSISVCKLNDWYELPESFPRKFSAVLVDGPPRDKGDRSLFTEQDFELSGPVLWDDIDQPIMDTWLQEFCTSTGMSSQLIEHVSKTYAIAA